MRLILSTDELTTLLTAVKSVLETVNTVQHVPGTLELHCKYFKVLFTETNLILTNDKGKEIGKIPYYRILRWCSNCKAMELMDSRLAFEFKTIRSSCVDEWVNEKLPSKIKEGGLSSDLVNDLLNLLFDDTNIQRKPDSDFLNRVFVVNL